jgi:hypothetical protein
MVRVIDIITAADTADQGSVVYTRLREELARADAQVTVSFEGVQTATSSFVNGFRTAALGFPDGRYSPPLAGRRIYTPDQ